MQTLGDILTTCDILKAAFESAPCDFCETGQPVLTYTDPETGCLYCLPCLVEATDPANQLPELPPTEEDKAMAREVVAAYRRAA